MNDNNLEAYIAKQQQDYQKNNEKFNRKKKRFKPVLIMFSVIFIVLISFAFLLDLFYKQYIYNYYKSDSANISEAMPELSDSLDAITYPGLFDKYEHDYLGNKLMNSLNYGLVAENQYGYTIIGANGETQLHYGDSSSTISNEPISQINISQDYVIYKGKDKELYICKHDGSEKKLLIEDKVGTVLLSGNNLYYVDSSKSNNLYKYNLTDNKTELVLEADINTFTILADSVLYLDSDNNLVLHKLNLNTVWKVKNVMKFYYNGVIFVQNNDKIVRFNINRHFPREIASGITELMGADENNIYYTIKNKLYSQDINSGEKKELPYSYDYYKGVYSTNGQIVALGGVIK